MSTVEATSTEEHHRLFEVNYFGIVYGLLAAIRHFRDRGAPGALINLGSTVSDMSRILSGAHSADKHAIQWFTDGLRVELLQEETPVAVGGKVVVTASGRIGSRDPTRASHTQNISSIIIRGREGVSSQVNSTITASPAFLPSSRIESISIL